MQKNSSDFQAITQAKTFSIESPHSGRLGRPRSIDADFILRMEQLGLSAHAHSMPYNSTFSGKTAAA